MPCWPKETLKKYYNIICHVLPLNPDSDLLAWSIFFVQNEVEATRIKLGELQGQQDLFDKQMAAAVLSASTQQTSFDTHMARAASDANDMKVAYDTLASGAAQV